MLRQLERITGWAFFLLFPILLLTSASPRANSNFDRARVFTRPYEFNFDAWTADAIWIKLQQS
ncbi:MAG TPA: hypothetical protein VLM78_10810, partial [Anaerolineales bacterium]|nr:hypothetical protein [Anaerolineales bacterium]